jgi:ADP-ribose pyrophosphatase YjhB (NUDIX family)
MNLFMRMAYEALHVYWLVRKPITVGVRILAIQGDKVLLVRHTYQDAWFFPGGGVKSGESLEDAIRREAEEEAGMTFKQVKLFGVYTNFFEGKNDHIIVFLTKDFTVNGKKDHEIEKVQFFPLEQLPEDLSAGCLHRVEDYLAGEQPRFGAW